MRREPLTVLFGRSGLGKTSLLGAGLFPRLREDGYFPVLVRLSYAAHTPLSAQIQDAVLAACAAHAVEGPPPLSGTTLWEFFQRVGAVFWNARNRPVTPVVVLDQFEEIFTVGQENEESRRRSEAFLDELGDLIENRPPAAVRRSLDANPEAISGYDFQRRGCKVVLSFREDFLAQMESLKKRIPSLMRNRYRLNPMNGVQAHEVVTASGGHLVSEDVARRIVGLAWHNVADPPPDPSEYPGMEVDPALLSVICSELNLKRRRAGRDRFTADLLVGAEREILTDFYERAFAELDPRVRAFVEDELITDRGYRDSFALEDALELSGVSREAIDRLVVGRLLRVDERFGVRLLELTHDVLTRVVKESRDSRKTREAEASALARERAAAEQQRKNRRFAAGVATVGIVVLLVGALAVWFYLRAEELLEDAEATELIINARSVRAEKLDLALLLGVETTRRYGSRVDGQVDLMDLLLGNPKLRVLLRMGASQQSYAFSGDGKVLAVGTVDGIVTFWSTDTWQKIDTDTSVSLKVGVDLVDAIAINRDGTRLATAGQSGVALWRLPDGVKIGQVNIGGSRWDRPVRLVFSREGTAVAVETSRGIVGLWRIVAGVPGSALQLVLPPGGAGTEDRPNRQRPSCLSFGADGMVLTASTRSSGHAVRWDVAAGQATLSDADLNLDDEVLGFSPSCELAVRRSARDPERETIQVLDIFDGKVLAEFAGARRVRKILFSRDGRLFAGSEYGTNGKILLWDRHAESRSPISSFSPGSRVATLSSSPYGEVLAVILEDGTVVVSDFYSRDIKLKASRHSPVDDVIFSPDSRFLIAMPSERDFEELIPVWTLERGEVLSDSDGIPHISEEVDFNDSGDVLASVGKDTSQAYFWSAPKKTMLKSVEDFSLAEFSPDGKKVAIARKSRDVVEISSASDENIDAEIEFQSLVNSLAFSWDHQRLAIGFMDGSVAIYDLDPETMQPTALVQPGNQSMTGPVMVAFNPNGTTVASAENQEVTVWNAADGWKPRPFIEHDARILRIAFSPDGSLLAIGSEDGRVVLYETQVEEGADFKKKVAEYAPHDKSMTNFNGGDSAIVFVEDGRVLVSGRAKQGARDVWDVTSGRWMTTLRSPEGTEGSLALSPKGRRIALRHDNGLVTLRDWKRDTLISEGCRIANRNLTCVEWSQYLKDEPYRKTCDELPPPEKPCETGPH